MAQFNSTTDSTSISRRGFIQWLLGFSLVTTIGGILTPIIGYLLPSKADLGVSGPTDVGKVEDFPVGSSQIVSVGDKPVIIVNTKAGGMKAFSAICTHLGCITEWDSKKSIIHCPCHDGYFNPVTGAVVSGPPPKPLAMYQLMVQNGRVLIGNAQGQLFGS